MAGNESSSEKTEDATPRRRQKARKQGTVANSVDLKNACTIVGLVLVLPYAVTNLGHSFMNNISSGWQNLPSTVDSSSLRNYVLNQLSGPAAAFAPIVGVAMLTGVAASVAQVGFVLSGESLTPNFGRLNPLPGIKRMFSLTANVDGLKAFLKTLMFGYIAWSSIQANWMSLINSGGAPPGVALALAGEILRSILVKVSMAWLVLAAMDYYFQRKQVDKKLRMTKDEVRQEMKEMEQSPELRNEIAQRRRRLTRRMMESVRSADVIITNPTHYAVALKYDPKTMYAPQVVAKGQDLIAAKIRELAKQHRIAVVPNPPLARQLYKKCDIGDYVPRDMFQAVAEVLAYVYKTIRQVGAAQ